jgi:DNA-binding NtrC family response regulator
MSTKAQKTSSLGNRCELRVNTAHVQVHMARLRDRSQSLPSICGTRDYLAPAYSLAGQGLDLKAIARRAAGDAERIALHEVLERVRWNRAAAARFFKVSDKTLLKKLVECGIPSRRSPRAQAN